MAQYGLGNFLYELEVSGGAANFSFFDQEDATNHAEVSVPAKDFPEGIADATSRQVADYAFSLCAKDLNDKRDKRIRKQASDALAAKQDEDARAREAAADFLNNANDVVVEPHKVEDDGTKVYNTAPRKEEGDKKK